ncbi:Uncharacterised protein [Escherichia coli]|uniref:Uncharacterized protein n=1 Tax=Escherichia coli TaxID=562 RepID=A0A376U502_ECOLX|nr:Uncharacterised protein [Escherichia coli]
MEEDISNAMEQLLDLTISLQTRINQAYSDLCDYTLSQCVISLMKVNVSLDDFISLVSDLELMRTMPRCALKPSQTPPAR